MEDCLFCKIAANLVPADKVFENDELLVFKDIYPAAPVHFLIIPKVHISTLSDCRGRDTGMLGRMLALVPLLTAGHGCEVKMEVDGSRSGGFKTLINTGPDGGQEIYHLHMHVIGGGRIRGAMKVETAALQQQA